MRVSDILERAFDFGTERSHDNFVSFTLKILFYIIPACILGKHTDKTVKKLQEHKTLGENTLYYILLQTFVIISILYVILQIFPKFINEFQVTIAGVFFCALYFGIQGNYMNMIHAYMG
jgi:hypothetical protein